MKILMVALFDVRSCGPTEVIKKIVPELTKNGNEVDVFSPYEYNIEKEQLAQEIGVGYFYLQDKKINKKSLLRAIPDMFSYDIVHMHGLYEYKNWFISSFFKRMKIPYVYTIHGNLMKEGLKKSKYKKKIAIIMFIKRMLNDSRCVHALSSSEANDIKLITSQRIVCIPNGVDCYVPYEKNITKDAKIKFLFIGRIDTNPKGINILVDAIKTLPDDILNKCEFVFAGPFETAQDEMFFKTLKNDSIKYIGPVYGEKKTAEIKQADYFILTSRHEGMPMAVLEALSYGVPCVVTKETNMNDIIVQAKAGIVCDCSVESVKLAILEAIEKVGEIQVDRKWIENNLLWSNIAKEYEKMYLKEN